MAVTIVPGSAKINIGRRPSALAPEVNPTGHRGEAVFRSQPMMATGQVQLRGGSGDSPNGWVLGFVQAQWIETNWVYYRGQQNDHGSLFLQRGRPDSDGRATTRKIVGRPPISRSDCMPISLMLPTIPVCWSNRTA